MNEYIQRDPVEYARSPQNITQHVPYEYAIQYIATQKDRIQAEAVKAFRRSWGHPVNVEGELLMPDEISSFPPEMRTALEGKVKKARDVLREVRGMLRQNPGLKL